MSVQIVEPIFAAFEERRDVVRAIASFLITTYGLNRPQAFGPDIDPISWGEDQMERHTSDGEAISDALELLGSGRAACVVARGDVLVLQYGTVSA